MEKDPIKITKKYIKEKKIFVPDLKEVVSIICKIFLTFSRINQII